MSLFLGTCQCGGPYNVSFPYNRIVNGFEVPPHSLPFQVLLKIIRTTGQFFCGGSLIAPRFVLTAAHCAENLLSITVVVGEHILSVVGDGEQIKSVSDITIHPLWNLTAITNDYAILTLSTPVVLSADNPFVGLVCLPPDVTETFAGASLTSSGWGYTTGGDSSTASNVLKAAFLRGMSNQDCSIAQNTALATFPPSRLCANGFETNSSICSGDSGGIHLKCEC